MAADDERRLTSAQLELTPFPVEAHTGKEALERVAVRVERRLAADANGASLTPVLLLSESPAQFLCSCDIHGTVTFAPGRRFPAIRDNNVSSSC